MIPFSARRPPQVPPHGRSRPAILLPGALLLQGGSVLGRQPRALAAGRRNSLRDGVPNGAGGLEQVESQPLISRQERLGAIEVVVR